MGVLLAPGPISALGSDAVQPSVVRTGSDGKRLTNLHLAEDERAGERRTHIPYLGACSSPRAPARNACRDGAFGSALFCADCAPRVRDGDEAVVVLIPRW
jgi:hypothetical protein